MKKNKCKRKPPTTPDWAWAIHMILCDDCKDRFWDWFAPKKEGK